MSLPFPSALLPYTKNSNDNASELASIHNGLRNLRDDMRSRIVAHRGFHNSDDCTLTRPLENTLEAMEQAWGSGFHLCECDVMLTSEKEIVLCHDEDLSRISSSRCELSSSPISSLSLLEAMQVHLKGGFQLARLVDVLETAITMQQEQSLSQPKLVIELKHGSYTPVAVSELLSSRPELAQGVAVVMGFDRNVVFDFARAFSPDETVHKPKTLLLACKHESNSPGIAQVDFGGDVCAQVTNLCVNGDVHLDGVYLEFDPLMTTNQHSTKSLSDLCSRFHVGVWGGPDNIDVVAQLVDIGVHFVNTDVPAGYFQ